MKGLLKGLRTTARVLARGAHTRQYPHEEPTLPERSRGVIALLEENCTSCMLCARECPDWCIYIDSHKEELPQEGDAPRGRPRLVNKLDRFEIDYSLCMYCGICVEVCPFDALFWAPEFAYAEGDIRNLLHDKERLGGWMEQVPPATLPEGYAVQGAPPPDRPATPDHPSTTDHPATADHPPTADPDPAAGAPESPEGGGR